MQAKNIVIGAIGVVILALVLVLLAVLLKEEDVPAVIVNTVALYEYRDDEVRKAEYVAAVEKAVEEFSSAGIKEQWEGLTDCLSKNTCTTEDFLDFLYVLSSEKKEDFLHGETVVNTIIVHRYWNTTEIVEFSQALTKVQAQVDQTDSKTIKNKWNEVVGCKNTCENKDALFFEFIRLLAKDSYR